MSAPDAIKRLVDRFDAHHSEYRSPGYNETQLRREFLDPLFVELGWDIDNRQGFAEPYKEVIHEDAIKIGGTTKAPDYCFRIGGMRKFFLEAKKPAVDLAHNAEPAFQLRRYAWSAKLPLSILSDFEEFSIYDTRIQPCKTDKAATGRIQLLSFTDYLNKWDEIHSTFSKQAILEGAFDKFALAAKGKKGTAEVDDAFLGEIESWRDTLARVIALRNPKLTQPELNFAVQRTIDRIIFLRICEDRAIEPYGQLQALLNGERTYHRLVELFYRADEKYNSGLFHFSPEKTRPAAPDELSLKLQIDDKVLKDIIARLYYPDCPYEFSVLPADILGQVYEQFLGKVIRLTEGHRAKVEDKPEVKKAGGVYYTPTYIVDYIVKNTVGKLLSEEGMTPKRAAELRVLDPACGSGSFLIVAYQMLLDWHRDWYAKDGVEKHSTGKSPTIFQAQGGEWRLTTAERKRILLNNIYGVDIDIQAVEVTKLSLLLKVLEGESEQSINQQLRMFHERALPDLGNNIKCGNSLVGDEFYEDNQLELLQKEDYRRINSFDWRKNFQEVIDGGGFDAIVGNPPYIRIQALQEWAPIEVEYYKRRYQAAGAGNYDIYVVFVEQALNLLSPAGKLGFILPHKFFTAKYGKPLRSKIAQGGNLSAVVYFSDQQIFQDATTYTCLLFLSKCSNENFRLEIVSKLTVWQSGGVGLTKILPKETISDSEWTFAAAGAPEVLSRLKDMPLRLGQIAERIAQGIRTSANEVYVLDVVSASGKSLTVHSPLLNAKRTIEKALTRQFLQGRDIRRYHTRRTQKVVIIPYRLIGTQASLLSPEELQREYPKTYTYLLDCKDHLEGRENGRMKNTAGWFAYIYPKNIEVMQQMKILVPDIANKASFALDRQGEFAFTSGYALTLRDDCRLSPLYVLGVLNSRLLEGYWKSISTPMRGGFFRNFTQYLEILPICDIDFTDQPLKTVHDTIVTSVERLQSLYSDFSDAATEQERTSIQRQIDATDRQIDQLVYELYGLTEEEIKTVESSLAR